ncbi:hypothetical protein CALVIDRAFT_515043 [Calocera viscosa TUFC12733]|uniref:F-box domain-containing protein n=1 Tax=Calocera viscosa (strain TUFC12733) TaxID=1330018 RepID=A0A167M1F1_CALVF|nr:hypothetical protein CALVIDRAFT_515043 [Calocera viscosa TUFC12733]
MKLLPFDVWVKILRLLPLRDYIAARRVCRTLYTAAMSRTMLLRWARRVLMSYHVHLRSLGLGALQDLTDTQLEWIIAQPFAVERFLTNTDNEVPSSDGEGVWASSPRIYQFPTTADYETHGALPSPNEYQTFELLPGGRWLLGLTQSTLVCFDLGSPLAPWASACAVADVNFYQGTPMQRSRTNSAFPLHWQMDDAVQGEAIATILVEGQCSMEGENVSASFVCVVRFHATDDGTTLILHNHLLFPHDERVIALRGDVVVIRYTSRYVNTWVCMWDWKEDRIGVYVESIASHGPFTPTGLHRVPRDHLLWSFPDRFSFDSSRTSRTITLYNMPNLPHPVQRSAWQPGTFVDRYQVENFPVAVLSSSGDLVAAFLRLPLGPDSTLDDDFAMYLLSKTMDRTVADGCRLHVTLERVLLEGSPASDSSPPYSLPTSTILNTSVLHLGGEQRWSRQLHLPNHVVLMWYAEERLLAIPLSSVNQEQQHRGVQERKLQLRRFYDPLKHVVGPEPEGYARLHRICAFSGRLVSISPSTGRLAVLDPDHTSTTGRRTS